jgi:hypothetical protein
MCQLTTIIAQNSLEVHKYYVPMYFSTSGHDELMITWYDSLYSKKA